MAKEIKVTFDDGGVYEGFANTYTLNNAITYYFSFDRDYRVQITSNTITLQEYRNAGAWYPIDIITAFEVSEISGGGGGTGDATQQWVKDNFVLKSGDTMSGALKFDFGDGVMISIGKTTSKRGIIEVNGGINIKNQNNEIVVNVATSNNGTINLYQSSDDMQSNIVFRNYKYGGTGNRRSITYSQFTNNDNNDTWKFNGKYQTNNNWFFKAGVYFDAWAYWRSNDIINTIIQNNGGIRVYNDKNIAVHEMGYDAEANYYSVYKYNGRDTVSFVGGQDPRYRITGYNNFANSVECYDKIVIKTEGQNTAKLLLSKGLLTVYDNSEKAQYSISGNRFDIYNGNAVICHNGAGGGGADDAQAAYKYSGINTYNYNGIDFKVYIPQGTYSNYSKRFDAAGDFVNLNANTPSGLYISARNGNVVISDSQGVYGRSSNSEVNTYIRNVSHNIYVQTSQTGASDARRDELTALLDLFKIVYNILDAAGIPGASQLAEYTSDTVLWIYDNQNGVLKPTITKIRNLIHN
jgi:hypothetical protein|nr:MAG TPA: hypothetical protein [Caudoviricetes sp.]